MIITEQKGFDEILGSLEGRERIFLVGCGVCAATWGTGGEREVRHMADQLSTVGKTCVGWVVPEEALCDARIVSRALKRRRDEVDQADAVLVMACGAGVQTVAPLVGVPTVPALNTRFLARLQRLTLSDERCRLCGECILAETAAICPVTLCPKGLMNGPCGGYQDGKCEVDQERDCAWVAIYRRMEAWGELTRFRRIREPKDWSKMQHPGYVDKRAAGRVRRMRR